MESIYVANSDEYETDSLETGDESSQVLDFDEIPESPVQKSFDTNSDNENVGKEKRIFSTNHNVFTSYSNSIQTKKPSKNLPPIILAKNKSFNIKGKILDYREDVCKKINKNDLNKIKFKDFKEMKKSFNNSAQLKSSRDKTDYNNRVSENNTNQSNLISQKMKNMKNIINILSERISQLDSKIPSDKKTFINNRKSTYFNNSNIIVENSICEKSLEKNTKDSIELSHDEVSDSLQSLVDDDEAVFKRQIESNEIKQFISKKMTLSSKDAQIIVNESFDKEDQKEMSNDEIEETFEIDSLDSDSSIYQSVEESSKHDSPKKAKHNTDDEDSEIKLKVFKKKTYKKVDNMSKFFDCSKEDVQMLHSPVRKKNERKKLFGFMCKFCQDYYASRDLSEEQIKKLVQECSNHRGQRAPYRCPDNFWETDFPSTPEYRTGKTGGNKIESKNTINRSCKATKFVNKNYNENYHKWEADIELKNRESNVLHSTILK